MTADESTLTGALKVELLIRYINSYVVVGIELEHVGSVVVPNTEEIPI